MSPPRILVLGARGQVGFELCRTFASVGTVTGVTRDECDLADRSAVRALLAARRPTHVLNAAAHTAVDAAETDVDAAMRLNADLPALLAAECASSGALLVHYSTDYVFDGGGSRPYREDDPPAPLNVYGRSKLAGEEGIRAAGAEHLIIRTSWVYGMRGRNFLRSILAAASQRPEIRIVADQIGTPTWCRLLAGATLQMVMGVGALRGEARARACGTYHVSAGSSASWKEFAEVIVEAARTRDVLACARIVPISTAEFGAPAVRPLYSVLSNEKVAKVFGVHMPGWREQLRLAWDA